MNKLFKYDVHIGDWRVLVQSRDIVNGSIHEHHIADEAITGEKFADESIPAEKLKDDSISGSKLKDGSLGLEKLDPDFMVENRMIADGTITADKIEPESLDALRLSLYPDMHRLAIEIMGKEDEINRKEEEIDEKVSNQYSKEEVNNIISRTPETEVVVLDVPEGGTATDALDNVPVAERPNKLFRVRNDGNTHFDEYGWTGTVWALLASKDYGIDDEPIEDSDNILKSGGVFEEFKKRDELTDTSLLTKYDTVTIDADEKIIESQFAGIFYGLDAFSQDGYALNIVSDSKYAIVITDKYDKIYSAEMHTSFYGLSERFGDFDYLTLYNGIDEMFDYKDVSDYDVNIAGHSLMICDRNSVPMVVI